MRKIEIELSEREHANLELLLGYAMGAAHEAGMREFYRQFTHITNRLNEANPDFIPYVLPRYYLQERDEDHESWWAARPGCETRILPGTSEEGGA